MITASRVRAALAVLLCAGNALGAGSATGDVTYEYHFDRNALVQSLRVGDSLLAVTASGNLLGFDLPSLRQSGEWIGDARVEAIGADTRGPVAALSDGRLMRVGVRPLHLAEWRRVPGRPVWVGGNSRGLVVACEDEHARLTVHDLARGRVHDVGWRNGTATWLLDGRERLWIGFDQGEFGGGCRMLDLRWDRLLEIPAAGSEATWAGIAGFFETPSGEVWAHGGVWHLGYAGAFVDRVDQGRGRELFADGGEVQDKRGERPRMPISNLLADGPDGVLVFAIDGLFRADRRLARWTALGDLDVHLSAGRPDAVGSYPGLSTVHRLEDGVVVASTRGDGLVRIAGGVLTPATLEGQLPIDEILGAAVTGDRLLLFPVYDHDSPWALAQGRWQELRIEPPLEAPTRYAFWMNRVLAASPDELITVSSESVTPGATGLVIRWRGGRPEVLAQERDLLEADECYVTAEGRLWGYRELPGGPLPSGVGSGTARRLIPGTDLLFRHEPAFLRSIHRAHRENGKLEQVPVLEGGRERELLDAARGGAGELIVATADGLRSLDLSSGAVSRLSGPGGRVTRLARDGRGRLWLAGERLWIQEPAGGFAEVPVPPLRGGALTPETVSRLVAHPGRPDSMIVAVYRRGVFVVQVP